MTDCILVLSVSLTLAVSIPNHSTYDVVGTGKYASHVFAICLHKHLQPTVVSHDHRSELIASVAGTFNAVDMRQSRRAPAPRILSNH